MLNPTQTTQLDALNKKITEGYKPTATDTANINYATKQGYKAPATKVNLIPGTPMASAFDVTKDAKYQDLLRKNEELAKTQKLSTDATAAGTAAGADEYSKGLTDIATKIRENIQPTFTPAQQKANVTGLLETQAKQRGLKESFQAGVDLTGQQAGVPMSDVRGQQAAIQNQYLRQSGVLSDQEANLLSAVNLSSQERQALVNGEINIANIQDKVQTHIDSAKQAVLDQAKTLTTQAQTNLASALDSLKGTTWDKLSTEQQNQLYELAKQGGYPVSVLQAGMDAVAKQTTLDNATKNIPEIKTIKDAEGNDINVQYNPTTKTWDVVTPTVKTTNLGSPVGQINGLDSYDTETTNPGMNRSDRNNNPGNIKLSDFTKNFEGIIGVESKQAQDGGNFLVFSNPEAGINAIGKLLQQGKSYKGVTAEQAIKKYNGNGAYGAADIGLDPNKDFQSQISNPETLKSVSNAIAKKEGFTGTQPITPPTIDTRVATWVKHLESGGKLSDIVGKNDKDTAALKTAVLQQKFSLGNISKQDALVNEQLQNKISQIDELINTTSTSGRHVVGPTGLFGRGVVFNLKKLSGKEQEFVGSLKQLTAKETMDTLVNLKKAGGTLGALSDSERIMLQNAATKIGGWEKKDAQGNGIGIWQISEGAMKKELTTLKTLAEKAIKEAGGQSGIINTLEQNLAANPEKLNDYNLIVSNNPNLTNDEINQVLGFNE